MDDKFFQKINYNILKQIYVHGDNRPVVYTHRNPLVRWLFWKRLKAIFNLLPNKNNLNIMDFGGGSGVFLPTLSKYYNSVTCIDLDTTNASHIVDRFSLYNVEIITDDVFNTTKRTWDIIIAADVLEHFYDLEAVCRLLNNMSNGYLVTSTPTESKFYELGRKLFGFKKPSDHYHNAYTIDQFLSKYFVCLSRKNIPINFCSFLSVFKINLYKKRT